MIEGTIIKGYAGFYYVFAENEVWECSLRGRFKVKKQDFITGDKVEIMPSQGNKATIEKVLDRKNSLIRPTIANVDQVFVVMAATSPDPDFILLDRLIVQGMNKGIKVIVLFTKCDLIEKSETKIPIDYYRKVCFEAIGVSIITGQGIIEAGKLFENKISVLAGPSGVGKSSLLNAFDNSMNLKTGAVSRKLSRGKHTTRHVELLKVAGGLVADTPGFSSLFLPEMKREDLRNYFTEFDNYRTNCRFKSCLHDKEPDCAVKEAVKSGKIMMGRYENYLYFLKEVIEKEHKY
ncbi:MAG: ribosome small subunit-dependent GTPase A [Eubacteriales bacterium]